VALQLWRALAGWAAAASSLSRLHQTVLGWHVVSTSNLTAAFSALQTGPLLLYSSNYSIYPITRLSGPRSRPNSLRKILRSARESNPGPLCLQSATLTTRLQRRFECNLNIKINFKERVRGDPLAALVNTVISPRFSLQVEYLGNFFIEGQLPSERLPYFEGQDLIVIITFQSTWQVCVKQLHFHWVSLSLSKKWTRIEREYLQTAWWRT
jgi:hypothetical protein